MPRSATEVMQDIIYAAVIDGVVALKAASRGLPNTLLRDLNAIHANTTLADLPTELQAAIGASVRGAFTRLLKEGYNVAPGQAAPARAAPPRRDGPPSPGGNRRPPRREPGGQDRPARRDPGGAPRGPRSGPRGGPRKPSS